MKKLIVMGIVAVMVMGMGVAANAYVMAGSAKDTNGMNFMTALQFGDTADSKTAQPAPTAGTVELAIPTNQNWTPGADPGALNYKALVKTNPVSLTKGWTFMLWGNSFTATEGKANVKFWISSVGNGTNLGSVMPSDRPYEVVTLSGTQVWTGALDANKKTEAAPWVSFQWNVHNTATPAVDADGFILRQVVVPEPGSMLAMFSGLVGFVGFGIRRRK